MKPWASLSAAARLCALSLLCGMPERILQAQSPVPEVATNLAKRWPSLVEVREKWDGQSLDVVRQAAEKGDLTAEHYLGFCYSSGERAQSNAALALSWYQRAGEAGYLPSFNNLGVLYHEGKLVPHDPARAIGYYRQAASGGMAQAQANLAFAYQNGEGVAADAQEALKWFRQAADRGHTTAMVNVGRAYRFGQGVPKDSQAAIRWFQAADERGDSLGTVNLGWMYGYVDESPRNEVKALGLFQKAADRGQPDSMYELYLAYKNGRGVAIEPQMASIWLAKAAEAGNAMAQSVFGGRFAEPPYEADPHGRQPKNMPEAVRWYRLSADQGCSRGQYYLGLCYLEADGVEKEEARGLELIRHAADQGYNRALFDLAGLYARGIGAPRNDLDQPLELLKRVTRSSTKSLDGVTKWAYDGIFFRYQYGVGTERDLVAAAEVYCHAAEEGVWEYSLADKLEPGAPRSKPDKGGSFTGSPELSWIAVRNPDLGGMSDESRQVLSVYLKAAKSNPASLADIGGRYLTGRGVLKNQTNAWLWLTLALQHGAAEARPTIVAIETHMTPAELEEAKRSLPKLVQTLSIVSRTVGETSLPHR